MSAPTSLRHQPLGRHRSRSSRHRRPFGAVIAGLLAVSACGISTDNEAQAIEDYPEELFATTTTEAVPDEPPEPDYVLPLFFVNDADRLVIIRRPTETPPTEQDALDALAGRPTDVELAEYPEQDVSTRLPPGSEPQLTDITGDGVMEVMVQGEELRLASVETPLRFGLIYAQIVCTVTRMLEPRVTAVQISDAEGEIRGIGAEGVLEGPTSPTDVNNCKTGEEIALEEAEAAQDSSSTTEGEGEG